MTKTWVDYRGWEKLKGKIPEEFAWNCQTAKNEKKGKARGGIITGIKERWEGTAEISDSEGLLGRKVKIEGEIWSIYIVYSNRKMSRIGKERSEKLEQAKEEVIIIGRDFNARIGREGKLYSGELEEEQEKKNLKTK
ncbi:hypothetical protein K0M31_001907 [Melipona bicolor]|uniref:Uncharacterized protein n=1 Tax=Melipona bicolor TaxID=60889 RepID=A0AA40GGF9_9HYME|nr:hypothetical protein K0M31_001907 [Melipona bicolor]